jgi:hypothetical protein
MTSNPPDVTFQPDVGKSKATPKPRSFLFINKDAESEILSRSSGRVATSINSHVQRWQDKRGGRSSKSQVKPHPTQATGTKAPSYKDCVTKFRPKPRKRIEKNAPKERLPFERERSESSSSGPATTYSTTPESLEGSSESDSILEVVNRDVSPPSKDAIYRANFSGTDCIDPFQSTYAHHPGVQPILQYYIRFSLVSTFQSDAKAKGFKKEPPHFPAIRRIVWGSLTQQMHMYALLAATAARMKRVDGITLSREISPEVLLHKAIRCIREHLALCTGPLSADDRQVILDNFYLCICQWYEKSYAVARTHLAFVRCFWNSLRPSESIFDKYIHDMITYNDVFLAIETASPPLFELTWEPGNLPADCARDIEDEVAEIPLRFSQSPLSVPTSNYSPLSASPSGSFTMKPTSASPIAAGFVNLTTSSNFRLPGDLLAILKDLIPLIQTAHHHRHAPDPRRPEQAQWVSMKTQALLHKLLSLNPPSSTLSSTITLTLIILLSCMSTSAAWRAGKVDLPQLANRLRTTLSLQPWQDAHYPIVVDNIHYEATTLPALSPSVRGIEDSLLLWILITGAFAAQRHPPGEQWFLAQAAQCARRMGVYDDVTLQTELMRYLYLEHLEAVTLERLCITLQLK